MGMTLDNYNQLVGSGITIYGSRERIRSQLIDFAKDYLQLKTVDLYKTSVISYIVDTLSILSANHLFYDSVIYREFFMVEAQMQDSVYNLVRWIGYSVPKATPSKVDMLFTIPLGFSANQISFSIPTTFQAYAGNTIFTVDSISQSDTSGTNIAAAQFIFNAEAFKQLPAAANGKIANNTILTVRDSRGFNRPVFVSSDGKYGSFSLPFTQQQRVVTQFLIPNNIQQYQFYSKLLTYSGMVSGINVWVAEPPAGQKIKLDTTKAPNFDHNIPADTYTTATTGFTPWETWSESPNGIYTMAPGVPEFVFVGGANKGEIFFGNGIIGKQPAAGSAVTVELFVTNGADGQVIPYSVTKGDSLTYAAAADTASKASSKVYAISYEINNPSQSVGGENTPTLPEIKRQAIVNLRSKKRLVSDDDYNDINTILGSSFPSTETYPILKRSDLKVNEIMAFVRLMYHDYPSYLPQIVPTRNVKFSVYDPLFINDSYTVYRTTKIMIDNNYYETLFNITMNKTTMMAYYDYVLQNIVGSPVSLYEQREYSYYQQYTYIPISTIDFNVALPITTSTSSSSSQHSSVFPLDINVHVNYVPNPDAPEDMKLSAFRCRMVTKWGNLQEYVADMETIVVNGQTTYQFYFQIPDYLTIPNEVQRYELYIDGYGFLRDSEGYFINEQGQRLVDDSVPPKPITNTNLAVEGWMQLSSNYTDVMVRKDLSDTMFSTVTKTSVWDGIDHPGEIRYDIHNVPTILSNYLDNGSGGGILNRADNQQFPNFESVVLNGLISSLNMVGVRMLTDSINVKTPDTYGTLNNLKYNPVDYIVDSRFHTPFAWETPSGITFVPPEAGTSSSSSSAPTTGTYFIVNGPVPGYEGTYDLASYINYIAELFPAAGGEGADVWYLTKPLRGTYVRVKDELDDSGDEKVLAYNGDSWIDVQSFTIPLKVQLKVELDPKITISGQTAKDTIKQALINHFSPYMGTNKNLDRSEINEVVRSIPGVVYCEVLEPSIDIRFKYDINHDLSQEQLVDYTVQYVGFIEDSIEVDII